jgi:sn-glycerol 3-phosphate transport system permease protein
MSTEAVSAAPAGGSPRRTLGLVGQYAFLCVLALVVLVPVVLVLIQALSPPFQYVRAGKPFHPVAVTWQDRTWFSGGAVAIVARTVALVLVLGVVQYKAFRNRVRPVPTVRSGAETDAPPADAVSPVAIAIRVVAVALGAVGLMLTASQAFPDLAAHKASGTVWIIVSMVVVAATQAIGLAGNGRKWWSVALTSKVTGFFVGGGAILAVGPDVWAKGWALGHLGPALGRSFTMAVLITVLQVLTSLLAAYAFAFLRFPLKRLLFGLFMATLLLPLEVTLIANVNTIRSLGWIDSNKALIIPFAASAFGTFLLRQGFRGIPAEVRDATRLDGHGHLAFLFKFAVPLTRPVVASFTVIAALGAWNQYLWPRSVIDQSTPTAQITLRSIVGTQVGSANLSIAAALIVALPVILLLVAFQKQIIRGLTAGAVKG